MRIIPFAALLALGLFMPSATSAGTWTLGAQLGAELVAQPLSSSGGISAPTGANLSGVLQPGLRIGSWKTNGRSALLLDTGAVLGSGGGQTDYGVTGVLGYLHTLHDGSSPYGTLGAGLVGLGGAFRTYQLVGAGLGYRHRLAHGHGAVRIELREDLLRPTDNGDNRLSTSLRFGFDLDMN